MSDPNQVSEEELLAKAIPIETDDAEDNDVTDHDAEELTPIELDAEPEGEAEPGSSVVASSKIRTFDTHKPHVDHWKRTPNVTGHGAIHVKTFVTKLRLDAIEHVDEQINNWLDNHPEYEVKFVSQTIGQLVGKRTEDALFISVWV